MIKSAASLPLPPLLTQLPLTHHTTSDVLEICPLSSYRKTSLHRSCLITVCELQPIASYPYQLPIASCLSPYWSSNHRVSMSVKPSSYFSHSFHTSPCPSICFLYSICFVQLHLLKKIPFVFYLSLDLRTPCTGFIFTACILFVIP